MASARSLRRLLAVALVAAPAALVAAPAEATVTAAQEERNASTEFADSEGTIVTTRVTGDAAADHVTVRLDADGTHVQPVGPADAVVAGDGCVAEDAGARCPSTTGDVLADLGDGDDAVAIVPALDGGARGARLAGGAGADHLTGGAGPDVLAGGPGLDVLDGGAGGDVDDATDERAGVQVDLGAGRARTPDGTEALTGLEAAIGSRFADVLTAAPTGSSLTGGDGDDELRGGPGPDAIEATGAEGQGFGGADAEGRDDIDAGGGADRITAGLEDAVVAGAGDDELEVGERDDDATGDTDVRCGGGRDTITDHTDLFVLPRDCERVDDRLPSPSGGLDATLRRRAGGVVEVRPRGRCRRVAMRAYGERAGRTATAVRGRPAVLRVHLPAGVSDLEARACGERTFLTVVRVRR